MRVRSGIRTWATVLVLVAAADRATGAQAAPRATAPVILHYFDLVRPRFSGDSAHAITGFVEQFFRVPGNTGFNASIERVRLALEHAGYVRDDAALGNAPLTYRVERRAQRAPTWEPVDATVSVVGQSAPLLQFASNRNMLSINSYSTPAAGVEAELVDAGSGSAAELDRAHVSGKIVVADARMASLFQEAVQKRGALGVLAYNMPAYTQPELNRTSIQFGSIPLDSARHSWGIHLSFAAREALRAALASGPVRIRVRTSSRIYPSDELTLIAEARGDKLPGERFVFSAHVQEPGANDNASGVGTLAEMARVAAGLVRDGGVHPARTITFLWGLEISSTARYLSEDSTRRRGVRWGVSLDMVGEDTRKTGGTFLIEKMPDPSAIWTRGEDHHTEWGAGAPVTPEQLVPHYFNDFILARCLDQAAATGWVVRTNPFEGGSDHQAFLDAKKPGLLLWHFTDHFYHTDGDRLDKVSATELANVGVSALVSALVLTSANGEIARGVVAELERAARARLDAELALSKAALAGGGDRVRESLIVRTWTVWYERAIRSAADIEPGGVSPQTSRVIEESAARVRQMGESACSALGGCGSR